MAEAPPDPQPVQQLPREPAPILQEGRVQGCQGFLTRRTKFLKRWKKQWFSINPGKQPSERLGMPRLQVTRPLCNDVTCLSLLYSSSEQRREKFHTYLLVGIILIGHPNLIHSVSYRRVLSKNSLMREGGNFSVFTDTISHRCMHEKNWSSIN